MLVPDLISGLGSCPWMVALFTLFWAGLGLAIVVLTRALIKTLTINQHMFNTRWLIAAGSILLTSMLLRMWLLRHYPVKPFSDFAHYWAMTQQFLSLDFHIHDIIRTPVVAFFYTPFLIINNNLQTVLLINLVLSGWISVGLGLLSLCLNKGKSFARKGQLIGLLAMVLWGIWPQAIAYTGFFSAELPALSLLILFLLGITSLFDHEIADYRSFYLTLLALGAALGDVALLRPAAGLLIPASLLYLFLLRYKLKKMLDCNIIIKMIVISLLPFLTGMVIWMGYQGWLVPNPGHLPKLSWCSTVWLGANTYYSKITGVAPPSHYEHLYPGIVADLHSSNPLKTANALQAMEPYFLSLVRQYPLTYLMHGWERLKRTAWRADTGMAWTGRHTTNPLPSRLLRSLNEASTHLWRIMLIVCISTIITCIVSAEKKRILVNTRLYVFIQWSALWLLLWLGFHWLFAAASDRYSLILTPWVIVLAAVGVIYSFYGLKRLFVTVFNRRY